MTEEANSDEATGTAVKALDAIWENIVLAESKWHPEKSCFALADEYRKSGKTATEAAENFINWQTAKAGMAGFTLGLPGLVAMPLTIPTDMASSTYLQLRMVAVIGLLHGWDVKSDQFRTLAYLSLLGSAATEILRDFGVAFGTKITLNLIQKYVSGSALIAINKAVGFRLVTKAGSKGLINLTKLVPLVGGVVGGGVNVIFTRQIGYIAMDWLKEGPSTTEPEDHSSIVDAKPSEYSESIE